MKIQVVIEATSIQEYTEAIQALAAGYTVAPQAITADDLLRKSGDTIQGTVVNTYAEAKQAVEDDVVKCISAKVATRLNKKIEQNLDQEDQHRLFEAFNISDVKSVPAEEAKAFESLMDSFIKAAKEIEQEDKPKDTATPETEDKVSEEKTEASEPKYGFPAVKQIAMKLSKITDGKAEVKFLLEKFGADKLSSLKEENYDEFHKLASDAIADNDGTHSRFETKEDKPKQTEDNAGSTSKMEKEDSGVAEITLEMIRGKAKELSVAGYKEEIKAALKEIGAPALTKIPKDQYASFYETMSNLG